MSVPTLKELKALKTTLEKKLTEASAQSYKGAKLQPQGGKDFTAVKPAKEPKEVTRDEGAKAGAKEVGETHGKSGEPEGSKVKGNKAAEGVKGAPKEYKADQVAQGADVKANDRKEGVGAADKEWIKPSEFRNKIRSQLGLPLTSPLNKGNDGLNKAPKGGSVDGNKAGTPADKASV